MREPGEWLADSYSDPLAGSEVFEIFDSRKALLSCPDGDPYADTLEVKMEAE